MRLPFFLIALTSFTIMAITLAGCSIVDVPEVEEKPAIIIPEDARPSPFRMGRLKFKLPRGDIYGAVSPRNPFTCRAPYSTLTRAEMAGFLDRPEMKESFDDAMIALGYDLTTTSKLIVDEEISDDFLRTQYTVTPRITDVKIDLCFEAGSILGIFSYGVNGEAALTIEWAVYDNLNRKTVYKTETKGYSRLKRSNTEGGFLLMNDAFAMASHNLGADEQFYNLIVYGERPEKGKSGLGKMHEAPDVEPYLAVIQNPPVSNTPMGGRIDDIRKLAVTVRMASAHGSGFFIDPAQGLILTNQHVVGEGLKARVELAGKEKVFIADVLQRDAVRDVALIKLHDVEGLAGYPNRPVRTEWPRVGEDIYAIGAPLSATLRDTVNKGIVSAHRKNFRIFGTRINLIQGDVSIYGGNSGGPLLDQNGNIVGISVAGRIDVEEINYFIPIAEAFDALGIRLE